MLATGGDLPLLAILLLLQLLRVLLRQRGLAACERAEQHRQSESPTHGQLSGARELECGTGTRSADSPNDGVAACPTSRSRASGRYTSDFAGFT